ncbi:hypothetical protein HPB48_000784 [Haemaphysalis longicornis]|uniref:Uncharacterized protein n=1 Tax=Haemaphysalis longicornis TaxID=44386 RepID=A0A9J6GZA5_HAELO|nr:hypothetical protein HPB48_000784 [Haemaphysalis longicornis]
MDVRTSQDRPNATEEDESDTAPCIPYTNQAIHNKRQASLAAQTRIVTPPTSGLRPSPQARKPQPPTLPSDSFKLAIRPRNSVVLSKVSPIVFSTCILQGAKLRSLDTGMKIRINEDQNIHVASTPYQSAASALSKMTKLAIGETTYAMASYGLSPVNSCNGEIHNIHMEAIPEN